MSVDINNYTLIRKDRQTRGGGVAFYLNNSYKFNIIDASDNIEQLWISIAVNNTSFVFGVCYRPPHMNLKYFTDQLEDALSISMQYGEKIFCFGDVNTNLLNIDLSATQYFTSMLESLDFCQLVNEVTHITSHNQSLLDILLCSDRNLSHPLI